MSNISIKNFVDIDIKYKPTSVISGTRGEVVLVTSEGSSTKVKVIRSLAEAHTAYSELDYPFTRQYLDVFFANGGVAAVVYENISQFTSAFVKELPEKQIVVVNVVPTIDAEQVNTAFATTKQVATEMAADQSVYGENEKIIIGRLDPANIGDNGAVENLAIKYSGQAGAEMALAAYLSQIDVYRDNTVKDYMFTAETLEAETITDEQYKEVIINNGNIDIDLAGAVRNCGGNCTNGVDVVNAYVNIILHQTLSERLVQLLATKIKGATGISEIYNTIVQELTNYVACGYLTTDKIWTYDDLNEIYNGQQYTIITKGTPLIEGYKVTVLPFDSLSDADKAAKKAPPIYIIVADQYSIRKIVIDGQVI